MVPSADQPYSAVIAALLPSDGELDLDHGSPRPDQLAALDSLSTDQITWDAPPSDRQMAALCVAGLWLAHNYLDRSHRISQSVKTASGSYWHGIMHRREGDFSNAKYWFRQVGLHPIFEELAATAHRLAKHHRVAGISQTRWDPYEFVDSCQSAVRGDHDQTHHAWCKQVAQAEWKLLFDYCYNSAIGNQEM